MKNKKIMKMVLGYIFLGISALLYGSIFLLPFFEVFNSVKLKFAALFYILSYLFMFAGFWLLGKELMNKIKQKWKSFFKTKK